MKMNKQCLPCLVNQVVKMASMTGCLDQDELFHQFFAYMSQVDFTKTNPEIIGEVFAMVKAYIHHDDPYYQLRHDYNQMFLKQLNQLDNQIHSFEEAVKYAIVGNIIDFSPLHQNVKQDVTKYFQNIDQLSLTIDHIEDLKADIKTSSSLLYLGDNCGEICLDKLLLKRIKDINPDITLYFATRGAAVVNDSILEDAYQVGIDEYATIISNGDSSLGTVLSRVSEEFLEIYHKVDIVIAKGQANFESLSEEKKNIYFLLMVKCGAISQYIGALEKSLVCLSQRKRG